MKTIKKPFYGWALTAMGSLGNAIQGGVIFWSMGLYTSTFEDHFGASRAKITLIESFLSIGINLMSPIVGLLVDKWSARATVAIGTLAMGLALIVTSMAGSLLTIWIAFLLLMPLGVLALGALPSSTLISRWFRKRRGLALGISVAGSSVGGFIVPPLMTWMFIAYGWRPTMLSTGIVILLLAPVFYFVIANHPEDKGVVQEEEGTKAGAALSEIDKVDWRVKDLLRTGQYWLQILISGTLLAVTLGLLANLSLHAKDIGLTLQQSATLYSIIAAFSFAGKIFIGALFDKIGLRAVGFLSVLLMSIGVICLSLATSVLFVTLSCIPLGMAFGGVTPLWTNMISRGFGAKSFGRAMGLMNPLHIPITAASAPIAGHISDKTGSYQLVFAIYLGLMIVSGLALTQLRTPIHPKNR